MIASVGGVAMFFAISNFTAVDWAASFAARVAVGAPVTSGLFKRLTFAGVNIVTLAEGDITHLHIGFKGTMNAVF